MKVLKNFFIFCTACLIYIIISEYFFGMSCPFRILFGFSCPGCGMSRAINALLHFNISEAFYYHPLVITLPLFFVLFYRITTWKFDKYTNLLLISLVVLFVCTYIIRIILKNDVLIFDFSQGFIYEIFHNIIK